MSPEQASVLETEDAERLASLATLFEVSFNHFFRGRSSRQEGDIIYFQGHAAPG